ncbi:MAG TPA: L-seryl-tRNA(Sec) selenium transferase [bacterium]
MEIAALRSLPSVERLAHHLEENPEIPRSLLIDAARRVIDDARSRLLRGEAVDVSLQTLGQAAAALAREPLRPTLTRAVNATGIVLHTNLGRAPLASAAEAAVRAVLTGYATLEVDRRTGRRGSRHHHVEPLLTEITRAEAALAVNNNAGAVLLAIAALAGGRQVVVSRGELVEIGGSFRLPEVMAQSGATLVEVGTTNRTYPTDYERALSADTGLLLKVHRSNFVQSGFVHEASAAELADLGHRHSIPVVFDLGSGCLVDLEARGLPHEPTVQDGVATGCDVVTFSGDKLLGGPQAGLIVGRRAAIERIGTHPLARALRLDKLGYAALAATLREYLGGNRAWERLPVLQMLAVSPDTLRGSAGRLLARVRGIVPAGWSLSTEATTAEVGGGSLPEAHLPSFALAIRAAGLAEIEAKLREHDPPVFARLSEDTLLLDLRTLLPGDDTIIASALAAAAGPA